MNVCNRTVLDKLLFKEVFSLDLVIHFTIELYVQDYSYFIILTNTCFSIWCKVHSLNDKSVSNIYFMAIPVHVIKFHKGIVINRPPRQKAPMVRVLASLIFKRIEWGFRKYMSTQNPGMVHQDLSTAQGLPWLLLGDKTRSCVLTESNIPSFFEHNYMQCLCHSAELCIQINRFQSEGQA